MPLNAKQVPSDCETGSQRYVPANSTREAVSENTTLRFSAPAVRVT